MGLDMYLYKSTYLGASFEHNEVTGTVKIKKRNKPMKIELNCISSIKEEVGYWRKANQIHNWFVHNVQGGEDDCKEYYVSIEQMQKLLELCKTVRDNSKLVESVITNGYRFEGGVKMPIIQEGKQIENSTVAEQLLPAQSGFFFGSTDYDQFYLSDITDTIEILEKCLADDNSNADYYYCSSW